MDSAVYNIFITRCNSFFLIMSYLCRISYSDRNVLGRMNFMTEAVIIQVMYCAHVMYCTIAVLITS